MLRVVQSGAGGRTERVPPGRPARTAPRGAAHAAGVPASFLGDWSTSVRVSSFQGFFARFLWGYHPAS